MSRILPKTSLQGLTSNRYLPLDRGVEQVLPNANVSEASKGVFFDGRLSPERWRKYRLRDPATTFANGNR